jgi:hypothetical protein
MLKALKKCDVSTVLTGKNQKAHPPTEQRNMPMNHMRIVITYMLGSSLLDTEALTSGKGLFSSIALRLNSILRERKWMMVSDGVDMKEKRTRKAHNNHLIDPSLDGGVLTCTSSNTILSVSSEKQSSASPAALIGPGTLAMLSPRALVRRLDLGSPSLPSRLGRLTLTSFDGTAVVGIALLIRLSPHGLFSVLFE